MRLRRLLWRGRRGAIAGSTGRASERAERRATGLAHGWRGRIGPLQRCAQPPRALPRHRTACRLEQQRVQPSADIQDGGQRHALQWTGESVASRHEQVASKRGQAGCAQKRRAKIQRRMRQRQVAKDRSEQDHAKAVAGIKADPCIPGAGSAMTSRHACICAIKAGSRGRSHADPFELH